MSVLLNHSRADVASDDSVALIRQSSDGLQALSNLELLANLYWSLWNMIFELVNDALASVTYVPSSHLRPETPARSQGYSTIGRIVYRVMC